MDEKNSSKKGRGFKHFFAKQYSKFLKNPQNIAIAGAYFKSTTARASQAVLSQKYLTQKTIEIKDISDLSSAFLKTPLKTQKIILEIVLDDKTDIESYFDLAQISTLIITSLEANISSESLNRINFELVKLIDQLDKTNSLIVNWDDINLRKLVETKPLNPIFYGLDEKNCHVWAGNIRIHNFQTIFELNYGVERVEIRTKFLGQHQLSPLLAAASLGIDQGLSLGVVKKALETLEPLEQHFNPVVGFNDCIVIDDTYHNIETLILDGLDTINLLPARRRIVVISEIKNYEKNIEITLKEVAKKIYKDRVDLVFLGGNLTEVIAEELLSLGFIPERLQYNLQNPQITSQLLKVLSKGDVVLIKGSKDSKLSEVVQKISKGKAI